MKLNYIYYIQILFILLAANLHSQTAPYILGEYPLVFSTIESHFLEDEIDSVLILSDNILHNESDDRILGIAHFYKGQAAILMDRYNIAEYSFETALEIFKSTKYEKGLAMLYCKNADLYYFQRAMEEADALYDLSIGYSEKLNLYEPLIDAYEKKAIIYTSYQEPEVAIDFLKIALKYALLKEDQDEIKNLINQISTNYHSNGQLDSAILYFQNGLQLKREMNDPEGLISDYIALGNLFRERGNYEEAQQQLMQALNMTETEQDTFSMMTIYSEMGDIYAAQNVWNVAEDYFNKALQLARSKNSRFMEAGAYKKLGNIFQLQKKDIAAVENYEAALEIYEQLKNKINAADILMSLSQVYKNDDQFVKAKTLLLEALENSSRSQDMMSTLSTKLALAEIEIKLGNHQKGIAYAEECLGAFGEMEDKEGLRQVYLLLAEAYARTGNFKKAYQFHLNFNSVKDSLMSIDRAVAIKKYDLLYTTEKKDKEITQQKLEIEKQRGEIQRRNNQLLILGGGLALVILLASLLFFIYLKNKQLNQQKIMVLEKEKETQGLKSVIEGEEKERKRIARELHDGLGAVLATVKMQISSIQYKLPEAESLPAYQKAESLIDDACRTVREISHNLMPHVLEQEGLEFAIDDLCQTLSKHNDIEFEFNYFGKEERLSDVLKTTIFRVTQELLKNIIKHAQAKEVIVQLTIEEDEIILIVEDDGKGFDVSTSHKGIGLENIRSRIAYLKGTLEIDSTAGQGSTFTILLPLNQE